MSDSDQKAAVAAMFGKLAHLRGRRGLCFVLSHVFSPDLADDVFNKWYDEVHIPDLLRLTASDGPDGGPATRYATRWERADDKKQYLATYRVPDLGALLMSPGFQGIPIAHESLPGFAEGKTVFASAAVEPRFYEFVDSYDRGKGLDHPFTTHLLAIGLTPKNEAAEADIQKWYSEEHYEQMSREPGWVRSSRYKLAFTTQQGGTRQPPQYVTLHEFGEANTLGENAGQPQPQTEWTKKVLADELESFELHVWHQRKQW